MTTTYSPPAHSMPAPRLTPGRIALGAAGAAAALWAAKAATVAALGVDGVLASVIFVAGLAAFIVAVVALVLATTRNRHPLVRILASVAAVALGTAASLLLNALITSYRDPQAGAHWAWGELNLWIIGSAVLALAIVVHRRSRPGAARA